MFNIKQLMPFNELEKLVPRVEFHVHSNQTDGCSSINELLVEAVNSGLEAIAFTEHVRKSSDWFPDFAKRVREEAEKYQKDLKAYVGCEAKTLDFMGTLDVSDQIIELSDLVLGSVHRFPGDLNIGQLSFQEASEIECKLALGLIGNSCVQVLSHPGGMVLRQFGIYPEALYTEMIRHCIIHETAIEINSSYLAEHDQFVKFIDLCRKYNPLVSVGSDVHRLSDIGRCYKRLKALLG